MDTSQEEMQRACLLRAMEWGYMPLFATQALVPASFLFVKWWYAPIALVLASWLWHPVKYAFASYRVATFFCYLNCALVRWPVALGFALYFGLNGQHIVALVSLLWPIIVLVLMWFTPSSKTGILEAIFARQLMQQGEET